MEILLIPLSFLTLLLLGYDKLQAKADGQRIPEKVLLGLGVFGGAVGGLIGMKLFRHKTRKSYFWVVYGLAAFLQIGLMIYLER